MKIDLLDLGENGSQYWYKYGDLVLDIDNFLNEEKDVITRQILNAVRGDELSSANYYLGKKDYIENMLKRLTIYLRDCEVVNNV